MNPVMETKMNVKNYGLRLTIIDYDRPTCELAQYLIGKCLVRRLFDGTIMRGIIVETEAYPGAGDAASHSYNGCTERNKAMFMAPGTAYVYLIYGMYHCINISAKEPGGAVLIRAVEPIEGIKIMHENQLLRKGCNRGRLDDKTIYNLCNGPGKLCSSMMINRDIDQQQLATSDELWVENIELKDRSLKIENGKRVGIKNSGEAYQQNYRFFVVNNNYVSKIDRSKK